MNKYVKQILLMFLGVVLTLVAVGGITIAYKISQGHTFTITSQPVQ